MSHLAISLLGTFQIFRGSTAITAFESNKVRALFAYLAVESDRPHTRDGLAALLWPESAQEPALNSLRNALANLRRVIGDHEADPPYLFISHETIQFNPESDSRLDVADVIQQTGKQKQPGGSGLQTQVQARIGAANSYRGSFLEGFSIPDSAVFEEWVSLWRERLQCSTLENLSWLADYYETCGDYIPALEYARRQVTLEPWLEEGHCQVMRLLALSGRREQALRHYHALREILNKDLEAEPSLSTTHLYQEILSGSFPGEPKAPPPHNLPVQMTSFIGREKEIETLKEVILYNQARLVTLSGAGGTGKTRLAMEAALMLLHAFPDGIFLVEINSQMSAETLLPAVAHAVGLDLFTVSSSAPPRTENGLKDHLCNFLRGKRILLVLDSFECILDASNQIGDLLHNTTCLKILVTSRSRLNIEGEAVIPLEGLTFPAALEILDNPLSYNAIKLFVHTARLTNPAFTLTAKNQSAVVEICRLTQGMPLGILLATSWTGTLDAEEILIEIQHSLDFLAAGWHNLPDRQRSIRATFEYSWSLLSETQRKELMLLSIFPGAFSAARALQVCDVPLLTLKALIDQSLLQRATISQYRMHDLLRQFIHEKLESQPEVAIPHQYRFCQVYLEALAAWSTRLKSSDQLHAIGEMTLEQDNFRLAWDWAAQHGSATMGKQSLDGLCRYYMLYSRFQEGLRICRQTIQFLEKDQPLPETHILKAGLQRWQANYLSNQGETQSANQILQPLVRLLQEKGAQTPGWEYELAYTCVLLSGINTINPTLNTLELAQQGLHHFRSIGGLWEISFALTNLTNVHDRMGNRQECYRTAMEALETSDIQGDPSLITRSKTSLSYCLMMAGEVERALELVRELAVYYQQVGDRYSRAKENSLFVFAYWYAGQFSEARTALTHYYEDLETQEVFQKVGRQKPNTTMILQDVAIDFMTGQYPDAFKKSAELSTQDEYYYPICLAMMGAVYILRGDFLEATTILETSQQLFLNKPRKDHIGWPLAFQCLARFRMRDYQKACENLVSALEFAIKYPVITVFCFSLADLALILAEKGEVERAVELYAAVTSQPWAKNSVIFFDLYQKHIDALTAELSAGVIQAARQRGTGQNLYHLAQMYLLLLRQNPDFCIPKKSIRTIQ